MSAYRYGYQEARNIAKAADKVRQAAALDASIAQRKANEAISTLQSEVDALGASKLEWVAAPATAASAGTAGQIAYSAGYIYVCVGASTWVRAALATW